MARYAAMQAMGKNVNLEEPPFPYFRLPTEIRQHILSYTDLVTPLNRVCWSWGLGYHLMRTNCKARNGEKYPMCHPNAYREWGPPGTTKEVHVRSQLSLPLGWGYNIIPGLPCWCDKCERHARQFLSCRLLCRTDPSFFCDHDYAAYSPRRNCWHPPTPLFLVSKAFYQEAQYMFFTSNHFQAGSHCEAIDNAWAKYGIKALSHRGFPPFEMKLRTDLLSDGSKFLIKVVLADSLKYLRSLRLDFLDDRTGKDWQRTLSYVGDKDMDLRVLELQLPWDGDTAPDASVNQSIYAAASKHMWATNNKRDSPRHGDRLVIEITLRKDIQ
ncbi:hypothetical protein F5X99DRAFT_372652 [Biscogniauxia marginata]|nr:hypothetical protein F5X99DRAFT_372652 [Biscogniauxia marginata]